MSKYTDFFPLAGGHVPGDVIPTSSNYIADGINYVDITEGAFVDITSFPDLQTLTNLSDISYIGTVELQQNFLHPARAHGDNVSAIFEDTLVIGASLDNSVISNSGTALIYTRVNGIWSLQQTLKDPTPASYEEFGKAVGIYGDTLIISAKFFLHMYVRNDSVWALQQTINIPTLAFENGCYEVSIYEDTIVIGDNRSDVGGTDAGIAYVYTRTGTTWALQQTINNPTPAGGDYFGWSVSLYEDTLVVAARADDTGATNAGSVYVYTRTGSTWTLQQTINNPTPAAGDGFGEIITLNSNIMVIKVGSRRYDTFLNDDGFWYFNQSIFIQDTYTLALLEDTIIIGQYWFDYNGGMDSFGAALIYKMINSEWFLQQTVLGDEQYKEFGNYISAYGNTIIVLTYGTNDVYSYVESENLLYIDGDNKVLKVTT
jgi:hypothetical protein